MKGFRSTHDCGKVFSCLFARRSPQLAAELLGNLDYVNAEQDRR